MAVFWRPRPRVWTGRPRPRRPVRVFPLQSIKGKKGLLLAADGTMYARTRTGALRFMLKLTPKGD